MANEPIISASASSASPTSAPAESKTMHILVTIDEKYLSPFKVLAQSIALNNGGYKTNFVLAHSSLPPTALKKLEAYCKQIGVQLTPLKIDERQFTGIPVTKRYPMAVYYRLLVPHLLPDSIERVIYLDCDTLVINSLAPLWETDLCGMAYAAASHSGNRSLVDRFNQARLGTDREFFNTGVLVMDTERARKIMTPEKLSDCANRISRRMLLPDQDAFNIICGDCCLRLDYEIWNYDAYVYPWNLAKSRGRHNVDWVMENSSILHFCWPHKPWKAPYVGRFGSLYKHYMQLAERSDERSDEHA